MELRDRSTLIQVEPGSIDVQDLKKLHIAGEVQEFLLRSVLPGYFRPQASYTSTDFNYDLGRFVNRVRVDALDLKKKWFSHRDGSMSEIVDQIAYLEVDSSLIPRESPFSGVQCEEFILAMIHGSTYLELRRHYNHDNYPVRDTTLFLYDPSQARVDRAVDLYGQMLDHLNENQFRVEEAIAAWRAVVANETIAKGAYHGSALRGIANNCASEYRYHAEKLLKEFQRPEYVELERLLATEVRDIA